MLFNSVVFLIFLCFFFLLWPFIAPHKQLRWVYITITSFVFYGWWNWIYLFLLIGTGLIDFAAALAMEKWPKQRKSFLIISIGCNLGTLGLFKYLGFLTYNLQHLLFFISNNVGHPIEPIPIVNLILPVGISFYTFQSMSYTIDVYRKHITPTKNPFHFFAYLSMFPQLVAGPIVRAVDLLPQLEVWKNPSEDMRWRGLSLLALGYFKKVVIADNLAPVINMAFNQNVISQSAGYWWIIMMMFAFQIYCDFSGYSDIARGLAKWMGYEFMLNFNAPYLACSFRDFWSRWHISLSTWFRDYVYVPLGGSKEGTLKSYRNLWITMLLSGFWHGATWTHIAWGALHAAYLHLERWTNWTVRLGTSTAGRALSWVIVMIGVELSWVLFRARSIQQAGSIYKIMLGGAGWHTGDIMSIGIKPLFFLGLGFLTQKAFDENTENPVPKWQPVLVGGLLLATIFFRGTGNAFIYFAF
jgi:alginate O-acetyltransferase complex protein AlgI